MAQVLKFANFNDASNLKPLSCDIVSFSNTGDNTLVASVAGKSVMAYRLLIVVSAATSLTFKRGSTAISGAMPLAANQGLALDISNVPWYQTNDGEALVLNQSGTAQVSGTIYYLQQ